MQYDFNLPANGAQFIDVKGSFFRYKNGTGKIRVRNSTGGYIDLIPGQGVNGLHYSSISITDLSGAQNSGYLLAGDYEFLDSTITGAISLLGTSPVSIPGGVSLNGTSPVSLAAPVSITGGVALIGTSPVSGTVSVSSLPAVTGSVSLAVTPRMLLPFHRTYNASFYNRVQAGAGVAQVLINAETNVNGIILHRVAGVTQTANTCGIVFLAKSGAVPASTTDGDVICGSDNIVNSSGLTYSMRCELDLYMPPGKGLFYFNDSTEQISMKSGLFTIL